MTLPPLPTILERVAAHQPRSRDAGPRGFEAAVALVLAPTEHGPEFLVIRRAERHGDPWSGHAALPGGKRHGEDADLVVTARRETYEEVGVALGDPLGRLDDNGGRTHFGVVSTYVFHLDAPAPLTPDPTEVADAMWVPLNLLVDPAASARHPNRIVGPWPAWQHGDLTIWGLTHRILTHFVSVIRPD